ncbi:EAL domain-containing protein [Desulfogranum marinum]|uniref:bifunctional diguanylate cyclase/phosphodiesterase n=1 Tax=Desulfogranum marinum TaxID=453220 RepID=UPI0029C98343|nr:EAL domain-containing protein [Desulfogranum marinum]
MHFLNNISIRSRLFWAYGLIFVLIFLVSFSLLYHQFKTSITDNIEQELHKTNKIIRDMVETTTSVSIKNHLRAIAESNLAVIESIYDKYLQGMLSELEARQWAMNILYNQSVGKTGYVFCIDSRGIAQVHPRVGVQGKDFSHRKFIQQQIQRKNGYLEYFWKNPDEPQERPKALYMAYFEPWDWIISVTSYKNEFFDLINIDDFRDKILEVSFGKSGYPFVINTKGDIIVHPEISGNHYDVVDNNGQPFIKNMINTRTGSLYYSWKNPSDQIARKKIVAYNFLPSFNWIVASSVYAEEVLQPLAHIKKLFALILLTTLCITAIITLLVSSTILKPLVQFIHRLEQGKEDWTVRMDSGRQDEIGRLATSFNLFMDRLKAANKQLQEEIIYRQEKEKQLFLYEEVFNNIVEGICIIDNQGIIQVTNPAFEIISGYPVAETQGKQLRDYKTDQYNENFYDIMWESLALEGTWSGEIWNERQNGDIFPELLTVNNIHNETTGTIYYVVVSHDISELKEKEKQITHLAYHDALTDLPNRVLLADRLNQAIATAARKNQRILLLFIDLDNFKKVNDTVGHAVGDILLKQAGQRLLSSVRTGDTVARLGGDEFIIMIPDITNQQEIDHVLRRVQTAFAKPFDLAEHHFHITCSIGLTIYPDDGATPDDLLKNADLAMYQAKHHGKNMYHLFDPEIEKQLHRKVQLEHELREAVNNDEFQVYFQPRIDSRTNTTVCFEALTRWIKPNGTVVPPNMFIPLAEESGLIITLGRQILYKAIEGIQEMSKATGCSLRLSVNVSAKQFADPGFQEMVETALKQTGYSPAVLELEITESLLMESDDTNRKLLNWFEQQKIMLAIDDFGTGYSSMAYLKKLPISVLKIDKSFIDDILTDRENFTIVETIILMAKKLKLGLVAEGVEHSQQLQCLQNLGCFEIQGYFFSPPMPLPDCIRFLRTHNKQRNKNG